MASNFNRESRSLGPEQNPTPSSPPTPSPMLTPMSAWRILCRRTGGSISRTTFYRWLNCGKVYSVRLGYRFFIPWHALEEVIKQSLAGERY